jgi:hypothetical protein
VACVKFLFPVVMKYNLCTVAITEFQDRNKLMQGPVAARESKVDDAT